MRNFSAPKNKCKIKRSRTCSKNDGICAVVNHKTETIAVLSQRCHLIGKGFSLTYFPVIWCMWSSSSGEIYSWPYSMLGFL